MYTVVLSLLLLLVTPLLFPEEISTLSEHLRQRLEERAEERRREAEQLARDAEALKRDIQTRVAHHHEELAAIKNMLAELEQQAR